MDYIYGIHSVLEALDAGRTIDRIYIKNPRSEVAQRARQLGIPLQVVPQQKLDSITRRNHQGVIAMMSAIDYMPLENLVPMLFDDGVLPLFLVLDGITDVRNFGAIARTAECCGVNAIIIPTKGSVSVGADAIKTSAGALSHIPVCRVESLVDAAAYLRQSGCQLVCATEKSSVNYTTADYTVPTAIVMGAEGTGISPKILDMADVRAAIPMFGHIGSLNVSVAAGVMLYEVVRQRLDGNLEVI
ncbi:MAG: 23S rRNA (guanosine(2251)-2'-O)-methyltransferase RlmB [Muribaculaceae bacterium]|nr:23S rRNA (guanosine(2251)-2'-O)-methyltransferase RlmB [Muribaculaceae bacterium]